MSCKVCGQPGTNAFTPYHIYCPKCGGHEYRGVVLDKQLWERWVEGEANIPELDSEVDDDV